MMGLWEPEKWNTDSATRDRKTEIHSERSAESLTSTERARPEEKLLRENDSQREKLTKGSQRRKADPRVTGPCRATWTGRHTDTQLQRPRDPQEPPQTRREPRRAETRRPRAPKCRPAAGEAPHPEHRAGAAAAHLPSSQGSCAAFLREGNMVGGGGRAWGSSSRPGGPASSAYAAPPPPAPPQPVARPLGPAGPPLRPRRLLPELRRQRFRLWRNTRAWLPL